MSVRYRLVHTTAYAYDEKVTTSYGRAHLAIPDLAHQHVEQSRLHITPEADEQHEHRDYFGNNSTFFVVRRPHLELSVTARSDVTVDRAAVDVQALGDADWRSVGEQTRADPTMIEYTLPSPRVQLSSELSEYAGSIFEAGRPFGFSVAELVRRIHDDFRYRSGATTVLSGIQELLRSRAGVCQDFAHLAVGCLRSAGLAARYVSGYLETRPAPGAEKLQGADASHAWVSVFAPEHGWIDFDPTNNQFVDDRYVVAALGRDYGDVPPLKGVIVTGATQSTMRVSVDVTRIE